jgi:HK97 gp10 family phage protein
MRVTSQGFAEATSMLRELELDVQRPIIKRGLKTASGPIVLRAKRNAREHDDSGLLADSIGAKVSDDRAGRATSNIRPYGKTVVVEQTGPDGKKRQKRTRPTAYAHIREFGSKHVTAQPFMRPALDDGLAEAVQGFTAEVRADLDRRTRKAAQTAKRAAKSYAKAISSNR